ncbi:MAG: ATP-binding protein [Spirochaetia bacterium]|nr:ATP-binding protein [Spirochaetia bacterium]
MYFERKIDRWLIDWKNRKEKSPALIVGIRQCGKTESIEHFARNYKKLVKLNFWDNPEYCSDFDGELDVDTLISNISLRFPSVQITPGDTLIFFDEIQECPRARLSFKNFEKDGRYDVVGSGSYLGINGYVVGDSTPAPTGYDDVYRMYTMDFEEFMWALGYSREQISAMEEYFRTKKPVPEPMHKKFKELFIKYACVGGFPKAVKAYVQNDYNLMEAVRVTESTVFDMKTDFGRRKGKDGKPLFKPAEVARIQNVFDLIPTFLAKENKRFITSKITGGSSKEKVDAIEYLQQAHIVNKVYNLESPSLPLKGNIIKSQFKLFPEDIGIVTSMYGLDTVIAMNKGNLGQGKGAIYESLVFDSFNKGEIDTFYFAKESGLEIDFVICYDGHSYLVESKSKNGNTKSSKTVMAHPEHYGKTKLIKIGDYNVGEEGDIMTIPHYMAFILAKSKILL